MRRNLILLSILLIMIPRIAQSADAISVVPVREGLRYPWAVAPLADGTFLVNLREGKLLHISGDLVREIAGVPAVAAAGQGGLLDIVTAPDFEKSGVIFLTASEAHADGIGTSVFRAICNRSAGRLDALTRIFAGNNRARGGYHFGSRIAIDREGYLYVSVGDRNLRDDVQNIARHAGKTLRMTPDGAPAPGNPFISRGGGAAWVYSYGHRNAQGMAVHPDTGQVWQHEHGPRGGDEINIIRAGRNYGWPLVSYGREYSGGAVGSGQASMTGVESPLLQWTPSLAPSGLAFYTGKEAPEWRGSLLVGMLAGAELRRVILDGARIVRQESHLKGWSRIRDVRMAPDGRAYLLTDSPNGGLYRIRFSGAATPSK